MKRKWIIIGLCMIAVIIAGWVLVAKRSGTQVSYAYVTVKRGDLENTVSATGTLEPVTTVDVGTQVSGIINNIYVDFNDQVRRGQLLAVVDTTKLILEVKDAKAALVKAQAQYNEAEYDYKNTKNMYEQNLLSELEFITSKTSFETAKSSLQSSQNNVVRAERNLKYAFIYSPINGTVIDRVIEEGQTVTASMQTPNLFTIAEDLSKMEIHAQVDESDIGLIKKGQSVRFEVQAYEKTFEGTVREVRLQPEVVSNVVNYTVVVDADNHDKTLLPGMTATIEFIIEKKENALMIPASALSVQPTEQMMKIMRENMQKRFGEGHGFPSGAQGRTTGQRDSEAARGSQGQGFPFGSFGPPSFGGSGQRQMPKLVWYFDESKHLQAMPVRTGMTDGKNTEIIPMGGDALKDGMEVVGAVTGGTMGAQMNGMPRNFMGGPGFGGPPR